jgi:hypothetical protein
MEVPLGTVFSMRTELIAMSCNNKGTAGSGVYVRSVPRPGPPEKASQCRVSWDGGAVHVMGKSAVSSCETDSSEFFTDSCLWWMRGRRKSPKCCKPLRSNAESCEIGASLRGRDPGNTEAEGPTVLGVLPGDGRWRHSRLRRLSACCNELKRVWISNSAVVLAVTRFKGPINPVTYPNLFCSYLNM